jgi:hypothetical protein
LLHPKQERRRLEHGLDHRLRAFQKIALGFEERIETRNFRRIERTAKRPSAKGLDELEPASGVARALMRARDPDAANRPAGALAPRSAAML